MNFFFNFKFELRRFFPLDEPSPAPPPPPAADDEDDAADSPGSVTSGTPVI